MKFHFAFVGVLAVAAIALHYVKADAECEEREFSQSQTKYVKKGFEKRMKEARAPSLASLKSKFGDDAVLTRWDGVEGTAAEHIAWMLEQAQTLTHPDCQGFEGKTDYRGIKYEMHTNKTREAGGSGFFRLSGKIDLTPETVVALAMSMTAMSGTDETVLLLDTLYEYSDKKTALVQWVNEAGFPFHWRDGVDVSSWTRDENGVYWQVAVSVASDIADFASGSVRAENMYWGYRLEPLNDGTQTKVVLISQTALNGWMPKWLVNMMLGKVLSDYIRTLEEEGLALLSRGVDLSLVQE
mmetsp:Transcript_20927/g.37069  ORF Transcript_20927/g.37069 Transcript_20927/m.37069 type:complete len:297 (+) Transcript_20927:79-969(+)